MLPCRPSQRRPSRRGSPPDRKSTRLNSSHSQISYAVFCLKKKKYNITTHKFSYDSSGLPSLHPTSTSPSYVTRALKPAFYTHPDLDSIYNLPVITAPHPCI